MSDFKSKSKNEYDIILGNSKKIEITTSNPRSISTNIEEISYSVGRPVRPKYRKKNIKARVELK